MENLRLMREREAIRRLLSPTDPGDALTAYYALHHPAALTQLYVHTGGAGVADGFLAACITGADLVRPLVVIRAPTERLRRELLREGLVAGRPYHFSVPLSYASTLEAELEVSEAHVGEILSVDVGAFRPVVNVLVVPAEGASGGLRFEIRSQGRVVAASGTNWRSPEFAEIYVYTEPEARGRGWGRSVASACTAELLSSGVRPLYVVGEGDDVSRRLAADLGYRSSGRREFDVAGVRKEH